MKYKIPYSAALTIYIQKQVQHESTWYVIDAEWLSHLKFLAEERGFCESLLWNSRQVEQDILMASLQPVPDCEMHKGLPFFVREFWNQEICF